MVIFGILNENSITISTKPVSLTISLERSSTTTVYSFDKSGRLWTALIDGVSYRRGLNGTIVAKWNSGREILHRRYLLPLERDHLLMTAHQACSDLYHGIIHQKLVTATAIPNEIAMEILKLSVLTIEFYIADVKKFQEVYKPVGILPPDQYMSLVLQLTEGCSFNTCTFCSFYKEQPFRIKNELQFEEHILAVKNYLKASLNLRRTIFLGSANALAVPMQLLLSRLEIVHKHFDVEGMGGLFAFLDGFSGEKKTVQDFKSLSRKGLKRVYIGLESGNNNLLLFLQKPGKSEDVLLAVKAIKAAGLAVAIIILTGAGGKQFEKAHIEDTIQLINKMGLDADDIIYFSELVENEGSEYAIKAYQANLILLNQDERLKQGEEIANGLSFSARGTPHISKYDIRDFIY